jgi:hypothetical protein
MPPPAWTQRWTFLVTHVFSIASGVEEISKIVAKLFLRRRIASRIASAFFPSVAKASEQVLTAVEDILPLPKAVVQKQEELLQETCQHTTEIQGRTTWALKTYQASGSYFMRCNLCRMRWRWEQLVLPVTTGKGQGKTRGTWAAYSDVVAKF